MYCPYCGVKNDDGVAQCFICNKKLPGGNGGDITPSTRRPAVAGAASPSGRARAVASGPVAARLGDRLIAVILDTLFLSALALVAGAFVFSQWPNALAKFSSSTLIAVAGLATLLIVFVYYWLLEGAFGATLGKAIIGVRVTRQNGAVPGLGSSAVRNALRFVDALPLYLVGFFVAAFSRGRRRIGDFAAGTVVLEQAVPVGGRAAVAVLWLAGITAAVWAAWVLRPSWFQFPLR